MFQYGRDATTARGGGGDEPGSRVSATSTTPASTTASQAAPASRRGRLVPGPASRLGPGPPSVRVVGILLRMNLRSGSQGGGHGVLAARVVGDDRGDDV